MDNMLTEFSNDTADAETATFTPSDHLLGIVQRIIVSRVNTRIVLPGKGVLSILPENGEYYAKVQDIVEFCRTPAAKFEVTVFTETALAYASGSGKNICELLWQAAFHASRECLVEGCSKNDVVQFRHWPNLTRLPVTPNTARICALLTRHPTSISLIPRILGIDRKEVHQVFNAAYSAGIVNTISRGPYSLSSETNAADIQPEPAQGRGLWNLLFAKISRL